MQHTSCILDSENGITRLKQGDSQAWQVVLECYDQRLRSDIFASLVKRGLSDESMDDISQETWTTAARHIDEFEWRGEEMFYHWLRVIALNHVRKRVKKIQSRGRPISIDQQQDESTSSWSLSRFLQVHGLTESNIEDKISLRHQVDAVIQAVSALQNSIHREIALRGLYEGIKPSELADIYGMEAATISQILWRVKKNIRESID